MVDLLILALTVFTFQNNTKIAIYIHLLEIFTLLLVFSYQFTANCLSLPRPLLGGGILKPLTLPFASAFRTSNIETVVGQQLDTQISVPFKQVKSENELFLSAKVGVAYLDIAFSKLR